MNLLPRLSRLEPRASPYLDETETADCLTPLERRDRDPEKQWLYRCIVWLGIAFCLAMILISAALGTAPDPAGPAIVRHPQYGELHRALTYDVREDCFTVHWRTPEGVTKFSNTHC